MASYHAPGEQRSRHHQRRHHHHHHQRSSNPRYKTFTQAVFTAGDVEQFDERRSRASLVDRSGEALDEALSGNAFRFDDSFVGYDADGAVWSRYENLTSAATMDTFFYAFMKFKKGIFVKIVDNRLVNFLPFLNVGFKNDYARLIAVPPNFGGDLLAFVNYVGAKSGYKPYDKILPTDEWVANNGMFRFETRDDEGDNNLIILRDMFETLANERRVPDVELFLNRRDYPLLTFDSTEPYYNVFGRNVPLRSFANVEKFVPIMSMSIEMGVNADVLIPTYEDWARCVYQHSGTELPNEYAKYPPLGDAEWNGRRKTAVFRGSSTGASTSSTKNQRLIALDSSLTEENRRNAYVNVGITKWNTRLRMKAEDGRPYLETIERETYPIASRMSMKEQTEKYAYVLVLEGHVAAYRLTYALSSGSLVLLADSRWKMWISKFLIPFVHYVPVAGDLSDLFDVVRWCRANDAKCSGIARNAKRLYDKYFRRDGVLDYVQKLLYDVVKVTGFYDYLSRDPLDWTIDRELKFMRRNVEFGTAHYAFKAESSARSIGSLVGYQKVFRSSTGYRVVKPIAQKKNGGKVELVESSNGFPMVRKESVRYQRDERAHENYIGLYAVNKLLPYAPNFCFTYGPSPYERDYSIVYGEYVAGVTLERWLESNEFDFEIYVSMLTQLAAALMFAQETIGFVHYDTYPWNVMVQTLREPIVVEYRYDVDRIISFETRHVPILIDYGKSRALVTESEKDEETDAMNRHLVDHCYVDMYGADKSVDVVVLVASTARVIRAAHSMEQSDARYRFLRKFLERSAYFAGDDKNENIRYGSYFGRRKYYPPYEPYSNATNALTPKSFIDYALSSEYAPRTARLRLETEGRFPFVMMNGNAEYTERKMLDGLERKTLMATIVKLSKRPSPSSDNAVAQRVINVVSERRDEWFDHRIRAFNDAELINNWTYLKSMIRDKPIGKALSVDLGLSEKVRRALTTPFVGPLSRYVSPEALERIDETNETVDDYDDLIDVVLLCYEAINIDPDLKGTLVPNVLGYVNFDNLSNLALADTAHLMSRDILAKSYRK